MISGLKYVNAGALIALIYVVYQTHKTIWKLDVEQKEPKATSSAPVVKTYAPASEVYIFAGAAESSLAIEPSKTA